MDGDPHDAFDSVGSRTADAARRRLQRVQRHGGGVCAGLLGVHPEAIREGVERLAAIPEG